MNNVRVYCKPTNGTQFTIEIVFLFTCISGRGRGRDTQVCALLNGKTACVRVRVGLRDLSSTQGTRFSVPKMMSVKQRLQVGEEAVQPVSYTHLDVYKRQ